MFFTQKKIPLPTGLRWHRLNLCDLQISNDEQNVLFHSFFPLCHFGAFLGGCLCIVAFIWGILQDFVMCEVWRHWVMLCSCTIFCHFVILSQFATLPVSAQSLQLLAFKTFQPGKVSTLAPADKISLASLLQTIFLFSGCIWTGAVKESCRF